MGTFIPREILDMLSYQSALGQSLKQISLRETPLERILDDISKYRSNYIDVLVQENLIGSRFKSEDSILRKYKKTLRTGADSSNALMMFWDFGCGLRNILTRFQTTFVWLICAGARKLTTVTEQFISITSGTI